MKFEKYWMRPAECMQGQGTAESKEFWELLFSGGGLSARSVKHLLEEAI
jgi:hypothetical protein